MHSTAASRRRHFVLEIDDDDIAEVLGLQVKICLPPMRRDSAGCGSVSMQAPRKVISIRLGMNVSARSIPGMHLRREPSRSCSRRLLPRREDACTHNSFARRQAVRLVSFQLLSIFWEGMMQRKKLSCCWDATPTLTLDSVVPRDISRRCPLRSDARGRAFHLAPAPGTKHNSGDQ